MNLRKRSLEEILMRCHPTAAMCLSQSLPQPDDTRNGGLGAQVSGHPHVPSDAAQSAIFVKPLNFSAVGRHPLHPFYQDRFYVHRRQQRGYIVVDMHRQHITMAQEHIFELHDMTRSSFRVGVNARAMPPRHTEGPRHDRCLYQPG
eukprot:CAMPEP_0206299274 /NCGR_PEP_ID=MMETSP0106_2-20121207/7106_1 /ASSEMBLY_ACC=CAM_ASM_000206 /TAXON_ID=81532 /ORGANISM="Acanthoeca-like sp., Strain 10tr" /LENGTH=145 /DNA_ID=CAMNT_0053729971 /DNA_START=153 /DNA_END=586 /DNA_ORIENTATION=+